MTEDIALFELGHHEQRIGISDDHHLNGEQTNKCGPHRLRLLGA